MRLPAPLIALLIAGCASAPTPATRFPESPAHPEAPEAVTPPATPMLMSEAEGESVRPAEPPEQPESHEGHRMSAPSPEPSPSAGAYMCPMHSEVKADKPGACPICGMALISEDRGGSR